MQIDFHYYATYCAAFMAGYSHEESLKISYSAQFVDCCTRNFISSVKGPSSAATTQSQFELADANTDIVGLQDITRIWASFHFLPGDLHAESRGGRAYRNKYRLICRPNSSLVCRTVKLAKDKGLESAGVAMHVLADTWAHTYFAGTPSLVINNTNYHFYEVFSDGKEKKIGFIHSTSAADDLEQSVYTNSIYRSSENSIMNLGHGRAGHLPDYSFIRYKYLPAWADYEEILKDNPEDYCRAFFQMVHALKYLRGAVSDFETEVYDSETSEKWHRTIMEILTKRQADSSADWKALGERLSGCIIPEFAIDQYVSEYLNAGKEEKDQTFLGRFFIAAMAQKSMVTGEIFNSGNLLAGFSRDFRKKGFGGIRDFASLINRDRNK